MRLAAIGKRIREFDDAYANKLADVIRGDGESAPRRVASELVTTPLTYGMGEGSSHTFKDNPKGYLMDNTALLGMLGASAATRYVVPGAMITAAGAGLADLTSNFYESMSNTPVLPL